MATMIRIEQLEVACERLFDAAKERFGSEIDLGALDLTIGEYWTIAPEDAYTCGPHLIMAGDVHDDFEEIEDLLRRPADEVFLWHDLDHFAGLIRLLAFLDRALPPHPPSD